MAEAETRGIGDNWARPDPEEVRARIEESHAGLVRDAAELERLYQVLPSTISDDEALKPFATLAVQLRDLEKVANRAHDDEKAPYLRSGQVIDQHFKLFINKKVLPLTREVNRRINDYQHRKLAAERARLAEERRQAEEAERQARAKLEAEQKAKAEAEAAAARARNQERAENHLARAAEHAAVIPQASVEARQASQAADDARMETMKKASDLVRTRTDEGRIVTMKTVPHVEIVDRDKLDLNLLRPYLKQEHLQAAAVAFARATAFRVALPGAIIEMREVADVR